MSRIFISLLLLLVFSCGDKEKQGESKGVFQGIIADEIVGQKISLEDLIVARPAEYLSSQSPLEFEFNQNMVLHSAVGLEHSADFIEMEPEIKGTAKWLSTSLLQIVPNEPLKNGQKYKGKINGKIAFGNQSDNYNFEFNVIGNEILDINGGFEPVENKINTTKLILELRFAAKPDSAKLVKDLQLIFDGKQKLKYEISFGGTGNIARLESEEKLRTEKAQNAELILPKNWTTGNKEFKATFLLPAKNVFTVIDSYKTDVSNKEKSFEIVFSDPIANMNVSGFVSVEPEVNYKVSVENRTLKIRGNFSAGIFYKVKVEQGFPSKDGKKMSSEFIKQFSFIDELPEVKLLGHGVFLPLENKGKMQIQSMNVKSVQLDIQEILPQNIIFFLQNNDLRSSDNYISDISRVAKSVYSGTVNLESAKKNEWLKTEIDISNYFAKKAGAGYVVKFYFNQENLLAPCRNIDEEYSENNLVYDNNYSESPCNYYYYYNANEGLEKILIASSIALTAKRTGDGIHIWASDVENSKPISGLKLELFGDINNVLAEQTTNQSGYVFFPAPKVEYASVVKGTNQRGLALIKLSQSNWQTSRFDVDGIREANKGVRLFAYTERGVYRPGDTVHFAGIVREGISKALPLMPMSISVKNPMGAVVFEGRATTSQHGQFSLDIPTDLDAPTGN